MAGQKKVSRRLADLCGNGCLLVIPLKQYTYTIVERGDLSIRANYYLNSRQVRAVPVDAFQRRIPLTRFLNTAVMYILYDEEHVQCLRIYELIIQLLDLLWDFFDDLGEIL